MLLSIGAMRFKGILITLDISPARAYSFPEMFEVFLFKLSFTRYNCLPENKPH